MKKTFIEDRLARVAAAVDKEETRRSPGRRLTHSIMEESTAQGIRRVFTLIKKAKTPKS